MSDTSLWDRISRWLTDKFYYILIPTFLLNMIFVFFISTSGMETWVGTFLFEVVYITLTIAARHRYMKEMRKLFHEKF